MKLVKNAIVKAFSATKNPGIVSVKRFSATKVRVRRFSQSGDLEFDETVEDEDIAATGTDEIVDEVPAKDVAVFSDEDKAVDEVIAEVDGGDATPIIEAKTEDGFIEDTEEVEEDEPAVAAESAEDKPAEEALVEEPAPEVPAEEPKVEEVVEDDETAAILKQACNK